MDATPAAPDFDTELKDLEQIIAPAKVPLTCILLQGPGYTYRKTLIKTAPSSAHSAANEPDHGNLQRLTETARLDGVPRILREAEDSEVDGLGAETMFAIGSLAKPMLALVYCIIIEKGIYKDLTLDTCVLSWMKKLYKASTSLPDFSESGIGVKSSIRDVLRHHRALPGMNRFLFLSDGTFQITDKDFIRHAGPLAAAINRSNYEKGGYEYSNANYILMVLLLEKQTGDKLARIMQEHLFDPLDMSRTTLDSDDVTNATRYPAENYAIGQRISSDLETHPVPHRQHYKDNSAYKITIGMWSCAGDIAKLYTAVLDAHLDKKGYITHKTAKSFLDCRRFGKTAPSQGAASALAGPVIKLETQDHGSDSYNGVVQRLKHHNEESAPALFKSELQDDPDLYYKGGTKDGFTSTVYFHPSTEMLAIVLSNASGPVDVTEPIARYLLRFAMNSQYGYDVSEYRSDFQEKMKAQLEDATALWQEFEVQDRDLAAWSGDMRPFAGVYCHNKHGLEIEIDGDRAIFSRSRQDDSGERSRQDPVKEILTEMTIRASETSHISDDRLRLFPMQSGLFIDRLTAFRNSELTVCQGSSGKIWLRSNTYESTAGTSESDTVNGVYIKKR